MPRAARTNWPYKIDPKTAFSVYNEIAVKRNLPIYASMDGQRGFPSIYSSFVFDSSQILAETFSLNALIFNCFLTGIALASIVILGQSIKHFSIVHLLAIMAGIALILAVYTSKVDRCQAPKGQAPKAMPATWCFKCSIGKASSQAAGSDLLSNQPKHAR